MNLFNIDFPECKTDKELNNIKEQHPNLDPYFLATCVIPDRRILFENSYKNYREYQDTNFLKEITTRFHQRTWEMFLGDLLLRKNKKLKRDRKDSDPDIQILTKKGLIHIECVAITHGDPNDPNRVPEMYVANNIKDIRVSDVPEEKILLRITNALAEKFKQYEKRIKSKRIKENEPYVIAVNTGALGHPQDLPYILKAVFAIGYQALRLRVNGKRVENPASHWTKRKAVSKINKEEVDMTFFEDETHKNISAVIYSNETVLHHLKDPSQEVVIVHNPFATNPISFSEFDFLAQYYIEKETGNVIRLEPKSDIH
jgi:hypothetical protein